MRLRFGGAAVNKSFIKWIFNNIEFGNTIVELGSGYGTTTSLSVLYDLYSIENDIRYLNKGNNSNYIYAPLIDDKWYDESCIKDELPEVFDLLIIDGPIGHRRVNIINHFHLFDEVKTIIIDDSQREGEKQIIQFLISKGYKISAGSNGEDKSWTVLTKS